MIDKNLISFIRESLKQGSSKSDIENTLLAKGWKKEMVSEALKVADIKVSSLVDRILKYSKKVLFIFLGIIFLLGFILIGISFLNPQKIEPNWKVYVYDLDTNQPIVGAKVIVRTYAASFNYWVGCIESAKSETDQNGYVFLGGINSNKVCDITVHKDGYIDNGISDDQLATRDPGSSSLSSKRFPLDKEVHAVHLKTTKITPRYYNSKSLYPGDGLDILEFLGEPALPTERDLYKDIESTPQTLVSNTDHDLTIEAIPGNEFELRIITQNKGGIQEITNQTNFGASYDEIFRFANLVTPPKDGYLKEMSIKLGRQYILRLRDGNSYVKLESARSNGLDNKTYFKFINITPFSQH